MKRTVKYLLAGTSMIALASLSSEASDLVQLPPYTWQGIATTTSASAECVGSNGLRPSGSSPDDIQVSVYLPAIPPTTLTSYLSFFFFRAAQTWENSNEASNPQMHGAGNMEIYYIASHANFLNLVGLFNLKITPATVVPTTPVVQITGSITNYGGYEGCKVSFTGIYSRRLDNPPPL
jgi:hypothetical protein